MSKRLFLVYVFWRGQEEAYRIHGSLQSTAKDTRKYSTHAKIEKKKVGEMWVDVCNVTSESP
jgi:hypothetical protein